MAAERDSSQPLHFHYGLAYRDLAQELPDDEQHPDQNPEAIVDRCLVNLEVVLANQATLQFILKDIKLLIG